MGVVGGLEVATSVVESSVYECTDIKVPNSHDEAKKNVLSP